MRKEVPIGQKTIPCQLAVLPTLRPVSPAFKMPDPARHRREATLAEVRDALDSARCSAQLAGSETNDFVVRALLLAAIQQIDRAAAALRRLS